MSDRPITIVWFRQDLRRADNPALKAAAELGTILPIYILDDDNSGDWKPGAASRVWLHHSLKALDASLAGKLSLFRGDARLIVARLVDELPVRAVFWNRCYEPWRVERDQRIKRELERLDVEARSFNGSLLWEPWEVSKQDGTPYKVFTPFYEKGCLPLAPPRVPLEAPARLDYTAAEIDFAVELEDLELLPEHDWHAAMMRHWRVGEDAALEALDDFCDERLGDYKRGRDFPATDATSRLSPHLHFGEISPQQVWHRVDHAGMRDAGGNAAHFLRELGWREFSYHLLYHNPKLPQQNYNPKFDGFDWRSSEADIPAWQRGRTGFPIVDAGMRELWQTGYMHNRVRMIVASFLVKNMLVHWRHGEDWFWDCLVDADLANNSASWQWVVGSGADAAPYFRIFNPVLQSEKFDPDGEYLARYCPELAGLPNKYRHKPWEAKPEVLEDAGIELGVDYPEPMLDLKATRERALERFKRLD